MTVHETYISRKLPASALFIVIVIALVIGILCSTLILIGYHYKQQVYDNTLLKKLEANTVSGMSLMLSEETSMTYGQDSLIDLYDEEGDSVLLRRIHWGLFENGVAKAFSGRFSLTKIWMFGYAPSKESGAAIYLADYARPLSISGNTFIKGDCYLPEAGIKRAYIEGQSFTGENLVNGTILKSQKMLPALDTNMSAGIMQYLTKGKKSYPASAELVAEIPSDTVVRSFLDSCLVIHVKHALHLSKQVLSGNIILVCDTTVQIDSSAKLKDILIFAPGVKIGDGFNGSLQVFAKDSIVVGAQCNFTYPTALALFRVDFQNNIPSITIGKNSKISGLLLSHQEVTSQQQTRIVLQEDALLYGQIFADGFLDIKGKVYGNVICNKFLLTTPSTIYENHLLNATIDRSRLSKNYAGSAILPVNSEKKIIKFFQ